MAGQALKLINKLARRSKYVKAQERGKSFDKMNKLEKQLQKSPRAYKLSRKEQRRMDRNWGTDVIASKPVISFKAQALTLDRHDYSGSGDYGMRLTLSAGLETAIGLQPKDIINILEGRAKAYQLAVVSLTDSTHIRLEDLSSYVILGKPDITSITAVADVAGSLNNTYFYIDSAHDTHMYYVWYNVSAGGTDPAIGGRTGIMVAISTGASANAVASATAAALSAVAAGADFTATASGAVVTNTTNVNGTAVDASDAGSTGFSISVTQEGVNDQLSPSESNIGFRAFLSSEKSDFTTQNV